MPTSKSIYVKCGRYEMHATEWGATGAPVIVMWHGLARTGRDFDDLAALLAGTYRVICPDTVGRGLSQWSTDPDREYGFDVYAEQARTLADALGVDRMHWVGTSMGGALGIRVAATTLKGRIDRLVLNDIGPTFPPAPYERIKTYIGNPPEFQSMSELEAYFQTIYKPFGHHTPAQWRRMAETSMRRLPSGKVTTHYDPAIVRQFFAFPRDFEQWEQYDAITAPTLVLRGQDSDLLLPNVAQEMTQRGPKAKLVEFSGCGHAPALNTPEQIETVRAFLAGK